MSFGIAFADLFHSWNEGGAVSQGQPTSTAPMYAQRTRKGDESSLQSGYIIRKNLKDWKQFPSLVHKGGIYALLAPKLIPVRAARRRGCATAKRVFVKRPGTRPNPRKLYQEMPESVNPADGALHAAN